MSELFHNETILRRNCREKTSLWSFSCNSFVKFHGLKKLWSHNMAMLYTICVIMRCDINGLHCIINNASIYMTPD